jgi:parallel beta-helix repeat protein
VDAADPGDEILVATGVYTAAGQPWVVDIRKGVTIRGGYNSDFSTWEPGIYPTTLDGEGQRQVVTMYGSEEPTPTLEGLRLTRGTTDFGGGGVSVMASRPIISGCQIFSNTSEWGGGIDLSYSAGAMLINNDIYSNTTDTGGGGIHLDSSANVILMGNRIFGNEASQDGGGVFLRTDSDNATLTGNDIYHNTAAWGGGGITFWNSHNATLVNNMVVENRLTESGGNGSGIQMVNSDARLLHTTIARNSGVGSNSGVSVVCLWSGGVCNPSAITMTNTILVGHAVGLEVREHNTATLEATLWGSGTWANGTDVNDWDGQGAINTGTAALNYWGLPAFVAPDAGDYHIGAGAAINRGVDAGVTSDIDGDPRPAPTGTHPDLGADELNQLSIYLPLIVRD